MPISTWMSIRKSKIKQFYLLKNQYAQNDKTKIKFERNVINYHTLKLPTIDVTVLLFFFILFLFF